ncbi:hypothetical protein ACFYYN_19955 [Streptomyces sp. NPDC001902]
MSFGGLSNGAEPIVMALVAVLVAAVVFQRGFDLLGLITGGP